MEIFINGTGVISPQATFDQVNFSSKQLKATEKNRLVCLEPDYKTIIHPSILRRMSRMIKMGVASAKLALADAQIENPGAIITATGLGCLEDTEKFVKAIDENGEQMLTPTPFIQSTHNTVGGQIALLLGCHEYNFTYVHRGVSFESALLDAHMLLEERSADTVLVGGIDELTETSFLLLQQLGIYSRSEKISSILDNGTPGGEGASFFLLSSNRNGKTIAKITVLKILNGKYTTDNIEQAIEQALAESNKSIVEVDKVLLGKSGNRKKDSLFIELSEGIFKNSIMENFKQYCGEYHTASAFALWLATQRIKESIESHYTVLICNQFSGEDFSILVVEKC